MITPSIITYTVSDDDLNFRVTVDSEYSANLVQNNITNTKELIRALSKYYNLIDRKISNSDYTENTKEYWLLNEDGTFNGIRHKSSSTRKDNWYGRPPIHESGSNDIELDKFMDEIEKIIGKIKEVIHELEYITPHKALFVYLPKSVLEVVENELKIAKNDLTTITTYSSIKRNLQIREEERLNKETEGEIIKTY